MPALVEQIQTGGATEPTNARACFAADDYAGGLVVPKTMVVDMTATKNLSYCFYQCAVLTSLVLPEGFGQSVTNLRYCFSNCTRLSSLVLPEGFGTNAADLDHCFNYCVALTSLTLPAGFGQNATNINHCFDSCSNLTDITGNPNFKASLSLSSSTNLTHDSLMVVINGLQTVTTT